MEKKYKLTEETINVNGRTLYRIEALKDFGDVKKGDNGGFIEKEDNLSQSGNCWVYGDAKVYGDAIVYDNANIYCRAQVYDNAIVYGDARVHSDAIVRGNTRVFQNAIVYGNAQVYDNAVVCDYVDVYGNAKIYGNGFVYGNAWVGGNAEVYGYAKVNGYAEIYGDAVITSNSDYIVFKNWWSSGRHFTWTRSNDMWKVGCFYGTGKELIEKAYKDSVLSGREYKRVVDYVESIFQFQ